MPPIMGEDLLKNPRECYFCKKPSERGRWVFPRESSSRASRTTFVSNRQIPRIKSQEKRWQCEDHYKKTPPNPILKNNLNFLSKTSLSDTFREVNQNTSDTQKKLSENTNLFQNLNNTVSTLQTDTDYLKEAFKSPIVATKEEIDKLDKEKLEQQKKYYLKEKNDWYKLLTKKQREKIKEETNATLLEAYIREIEKNHDEIKELVENNIYRWNTAKHKLFWITFFIVVPYSLKKIKRIKRRSEKRKIKNLTDDIKDKFGIWRLNMYSSVAFYVVSFVLAKNAIDKWVRPNMDWAIEKSLSFTILSVAILLGGLSIVDNVITSSLKTPFQRLAIKIEHAPLDEKTKKEFLSKTQEANESFKETFKRFGIIAIPTILTGLIGKMYSESLASNASYLIPILYAIYRICEANKMIKKAKLNK